MGKLAIRTEAEKIVPTQSDKRKFSKLDKLGVGVRALTRLKNPKTEIAVEGLRRAEGTDEEKKKWVKQLSKSGKYEEVIELTGTRVPGGPYREILVPDEDIVKEVLAHAKTRVENLMKTRKKSTEIEANANKRLDKIGEYLEELERPGNQSTANFLTVAGTLAFGVLYLVSGPVHLAEMLGLLGLGIASLIVINFGGIIPRLPSALTSVISEKMAKRMLNSARNEIEKVQLLANNCGGDGKATLEKGHDEIAGLLPKNAGED